MSWDAWLQCSACGNAGDDWNYTHNTNGMLADAYEAVTGDATEQASGPLGPAIGPAWWDRLNGMSGPEGAVYLGQIVKGLEADPERFRAMNPENGWGSYDGVLEVMREMHAASASAPAASIWHVHG